jgi:hypothetical protein
MTHDPIKNMLCDLIEVKEGLSEREMNFVDSVSQQDTLSEKQSIKINDLWEEHCE